ncbi:MAG TPA: NAD-dependent epimerase/dehydratase family protein, partial [Micromonosporaceae bacterium]
MTGVGRYLGALAAARLAADPAVGQVIAVDTTPPQGEPAALLFQGADTGQGSKIRFVRADIQNPLIAKVIVSSGAETVVHMAVQVSAARFARSATKELNVIGTMQLLAACQK